MNVSTHVPIFASLSLIGQCNSHCLYCQSWQSPVRGPDTERWQQVIDQVALLGVRYLNLSGGEPLLRADLPRLIARAKKRGLIAQLSTNGLLLRSDLFRQSVAAGLDYVTVSMDTLDPGTFFRLRGVPLERVLAGMDAALQLCAEFPSLRVGLKCVVSRLNYLDLSELVDLAVAKGMYIGFQPFHAQFTGNPIAVSELGLPERSRPGLRSAMQHIIERKRETRAIINHVAYLSHFAQFLTYGELPPGFSCHAGEQTVNVGVDLDVKPCWTFPPLGNLADQSLAKIWNSPQFDTVRAQMRSRQCGGCWLTCHTDIGPGVTE